MPPSLANLQDLRTALGRLDAERPAGPQTNSRGQTQYEDRGGDFLQRLDLRVVSRQGKARVLVTGQIGVGKSSELWKFFGEKKSGDAGFLVHCDLEKQEHPEKCGATGVFLTILRDCWYATWGKTWGGAADRRRLAAVRNDIFSRLIDWLKGQADTDAGKVVFRFGGMDYLVSLREEERDRALALILGKAAQHEAVSQPEERFGVAPDSLIHLLNQLLDWITGQWQNRRPILIVDHVDKIRDSGAAEDVLLKSVPQWGRINASIIMTAPYEFTLGDLRHSVESKWGPPLMVYPLEIPELGAGSVPPIYKRIVQRAGLEALIAPESLDLLAYSSGGVLRQYVQFLIDACQEAHLAKHHRIEASDAWTVVHQAERAYQDYGVKQLEQLDEIARTGTGLGDAAVLLRSPIGLLVAEPHEGQQQLRVHPLARGALERYRLRKKASA